MLQRRVPIAAADEKGFWLSRRPIFELALAAVCGALLGFILPLFPILVALPPALILLSWLMRRRAHAGAYLLLATVALSALNAQWSLQRQELPASIASSGEYVSLRGMVAYEPRIYRSGGGQSCYFDLDLRALRRGADWEPQSGRAMVRLKLPAEQTAPRYGDVLSMEGVARGQVRAGYGYSPYERIRFDAVPSSLLVLDRDAGSALVSFCLGLRRSASEILERGISAHPAEAGFLQAILLGYRERLDSDLYASFRATGTVHIMAISGLHVGLIASLIIIVLRWFGLPRTRWFLIIIPLLTIYTVGTGLRASAIRACLMAGIYWMAPPLKRRPDLLTSLALAAILILVVAPAQVVDPGFQFSFAIVLGLIMLMPRIDAWAIERISSDPMRINRDARPQRIYRGVLRYMLILAAVTSVAWTVSLPLVMSYGNIVAPVALLGNLIVVPLVTAAVALGALSLLLGGALPILAVVLNRINLHLLAALLGVVDWLADLPGGHFFVESPPAAFIPVYYGLLAAIFVLRRRTTRIALAAAAALLLLIMLLLEDFRGDRVEIRDADGCVVSLFNFEGGDEVLVNTGSEYFGRDLLRMLRSHGVDGIELLLLTQVDSRHADGIGRLVDQHPIDTIWIPDYESRSPILAELRTLCEREGIRLRRMNAGEAMALGERFEIEFFSPVDGFEYRRSEDAALIFRLAREGRAYMLLGSEASAGKAFGLRKDWAAPVWILDRFPRDAELLDRMRLYSPKTIVFGGQALPDDGADSWMLYDRGAYADEF